MRFTTLLSAIFAFAAFLPSFVGALDETFQRDLKHKRIAQGFDTNVARNVDATLPVKKRLLNSADVSSKKKRRGAKSKKRGLSRRCSPPQHSSLTLSTSTGATTTSSFASSSTSTSASTTATTTSSAVTPAANPDSQATTTVTSAPQSATSVVPGAASGHQFTITNQCSYAIQPYIISTACGYSPACSGRSPYSGAEPDPVAPGDTIIVAIDENFTGRICNAQNNCGDSCENCSMIELNLDTGSAYTAQDYDISNINGFTDPLQLGADGCDTVTCEDVDCPVTEAYSPGDESGDYDGQPDAPTRACGPGNIAFTVVWCP